MYNANFKTTQTYVIGFTSPNAEVIELINHLSVETKAATDWAMAASSGILAFLAVATLVGVFLRKL